MPPGTGDAQLTMSQRVPLAGAVIVSTPQDVALLDARRGVKMFEKVNVPVLGLIENMSYYCCPKCGDRADIFGHGGARAEAARMGVEFLGELPLKIDIRLLADAGTPIVAARPETEEAQAYRRIAARLWEKLHGAEAATGAALRGGVGKVGKGKVFPPRSPTLPFCGSGSAARRVPTRRNRWGSLGEYLLPGLF